ncbi:unnamed protein product [Trichobilharzia regenti]|nr:unnamed protein product [Trichobilharzia regenti]
MKLSECSGPVLSTDDLLKLRGETSSAFERNYGIKHWEKGLPKELGSLNRITKEWLFMALKMKSGQDHICAMAYLVNSYPLHAIRFLDNLISLVSPSKKRDCCKSLGNSSYTFKSRLRYIEPPFWQSYSKAASADSSIRSNSERVR